MCIAKLPSGAHCQWGTTGSSTGTCSLQGMPVNQPHDNLGSVTVGVQTGCPVGRWKCHIWTSAAGVREGSLPAGTGAGFASGLGSSQAGPGSTPACAICVRSKGGGLNFSFGKIKLFRFREKEQPNPSPLEHQVKGLDRMGVCLGRGPSQWPSSLMGDFSRLRDSAVSGRRRASRALQQCMDGSGSFGSRRLTCLGQAQPGGDGLVSIHDVQA